MQKSKSHLLPLKKCGHGGQNKNPKQLINSCLGFFSGTRSRDRTGTAIAGHRILSPACLPIPPSGRSLPRGRRRQKYEIICYPQNPGAGTAVDSRSEAGIAPPLRPRSPTRSPTGSRVGVPPGVPDSCFGSLHLHMTGSPETGPCRVPGGFFRGEVRGDHSVGYSSPEAAGAEAMLSM